MYDPYRYGPGSGIKYPSRKIIFFILCLIQWGSFFKHYRRLFGADRASGDAYFTRGRAPRETYLINAEMNPSIPYSYIPQWLSNVDANLLMQHLMDEICWESGEVFLFGKRIPMPRLTAWFGPEYQYSGFTHPEKKMNNSLQNLCFKLSQETGFPFNGVLLNYYRNGQDSMGFHADNEKKLGLSPAIASISLGETREMRIKHKHDKKMYTKINLEHGSLLLMLPGMQENFLHEIPKRKNIANPRINLTFRQLWPDNL